MDYIQLVIIIHWIWNFHYEDSRLSFSYLFLDVTISRKKGGAASLEIVHDSYKTQFL